MTNEKGRYREMSKSTARQFADSLRNDPDKIIEFCKKEIAAYQELIDIMSEPTAIAVAKSNRKKKK